MKIVYLNETYASALAALNVPPTSLTKPLDFFKYFSYEDVWIIAANTLAILSEKGLDNLGFTSLFDNTGDYPGPYVNLVNIDVDSMRKELSSSKCRCTAVDANTVVLYACSENTQSDLSVAEHVFNALALIMPVDAVMQTGQYQQHIFQ